MGLFSDPTTPIRIPSIDKNGPLNITALILNLYNMLHLHPFYV